MWYEDPRDIKRDENEDRQQTDDQNERNEDGEDKEKSDPDYQYTDWASI